MSDGFGNHKWAERGVPAVCEVCGIKSTDDPRACIDLSPLDRIASIPPLPPIEANFGLLREANAEIERLKEEIEGYRLTLSVVYDTVNRAAKGEAQDWIDTGRTIRWALEGK